MTGRNSNSEPPRTLEHICGELSLAIQNRTAGMLEIGRLLNEAKDLIDEHGAWLPFLKRHRIEERTAQRYMRAAKWAADWTGKSDNLSDFDLGLITPQAIYALSSGKFSDDVVEHVISAAQHRHVGIADVQQIAKAGTKATLLREIKAEQEAKAEAEIAERLAQATAAGFETIEAYDAAADAENAAAIKAMEQSLQEYAEREAVEEAEAEAILDGGPDPGRPPTPEPIVASSERFHLSTFENAIVTLKTIMTKPLDTFTAAKVSLDDVDQVARFLDAVCQRRRAA
jgi:hypothetical protein